MTARREAWFNLTGYFFTVIYITANMKTGRVSKAHVIIRKMYANETNINNFLAVKTPGHIDMGSQ